MASKSTQAISTKKSKLTTARSNSEPSGHVTRNMARNQPTTFVALLSNPREPVITLANLADKYASRSEDSRAWRSDKRASRSEDERASRSEDNRASRSDKRASCSEDQRASRSKDRRASRSEVQHTSRSEVKRASRSEEKETPNKSRERSFSPATDDESSTASYNESPNGDEDNTYGMPVDYSSQHIPMQVMVIGASTNEEQIANLMVGVLTVLFGSVFT
ncbi:hypothetical protein ACLB2K_062181 [Fragaria x ananassa]